MIDLDKLLEDFIKRAGIDDPSEACLVLRCYNQMVIAAFEADNSKYKSKGLELLNEIVQLQQENAELNLLLFHHENGLSHPDPTVKEKLTVANLVKENAALQAQIGALKDVCNEYIPAVLLDEANEKIQLISIAEQIGRDVLKLKQER